MRDSDVRGSSPSRICKVTFQKWLLVGPSAASHPTTSVRHAFTKDIKYPIRRHLISVHCHLLLSKVSNLGLFEMVEVGEVGPRHARPVG